MVIQDLWPGADVRWAGPATTRKGVPLLRPGDRAVVVDPGRHHVTSFGTMYFRAEERPPRPRRGVTIRLGDDREVAVPRKHLEQVPPPDHPLSPERDGSHADWWLAQLVPWGRHGVPVRSLVPPSLPAVCQVLHPWWGSGPEPVQWRELAEQHGFASVRDLDRTRELNAIPAAREAGLEAAEGELDELTATALVDAVTPATTTPDDVFVAVWEGWSDVPPQRFPGAARLDTYQRGHFLLRGPLRGTLSSVAATGPSRPTAGLWWPTDRAWFVATEIDFRWTYVAGDHALIDRLLRDNRLEVARTTFDAPANEAAEPS
jgi:hypothetical protein